MKEYNVYLLDFDGTLIDSEESLINVFLSAYKKVGINVSKNQVSHLMQIPLSEGYKELNGPQEKYKEYNDEINHLLNQEETVKLTKIYSDTIPFLNTLKSKNKLAAVVTGNNKRHYNDILEFFNIPKDTFSSFVGNEETKLHKPNPEPLLLALKLMNYQGDLKDVCYIGDAEMDAIAALRAGIDAYIIDRKNVYKDLSYNRINSLMDMFEL